MKILRALLTMLPWAMCAWVPAQSAREVLVAGPGDTVLLEVALDASREPPSRVPVVVGGTTLDAGVVRIGRGARPATRSPIETWLDLGDPWSATPARDARRTPAPEASFWAVVLTLPPEAVDTIRVQDRVVRVIPPERSAIARERVASPDPDLLVALEQELTDPRRRWHGRIGFERVGVRPPPHEFDDPTIEAWATQIETRWREALARLWEIDPDLARGIERTLWLTASLGGTSRWPLWPIDPRELDPLADVLHDATLSATQQADRVRRWHDDLPSVLVWVAEPALDAGGLSIGALNLASEPEVLWARTAGGAPTPFELSPGNARMIDLLGSPSWTISTRDRVINLSDPSTPAPAVPPGVVVGPLLADWTLASLRAGSPREDLVSDVRALLHAVPPGAPDDPADRAWKIHVEARRFAPGESLRFWFGPRDAPTGIVRCTHDASLSVERGPAIASPADTYQDAARWAAQFPLAPEHAERGGILRLGVERLAPSGRRWSWPAARFPWDEQPGRAVLDLGAWSGIPR